MSSRILQYLHEDYSNVEDFAKIDKIESIELDGLNTALDTLENNQFIETSDKSFIKRREKMLNIQADTSTETLDFRKKRILNRYRTKPPFTIRYLQQQLDFLLGEDVAIATVDVLNFLLTISTDVKDPNLYNELKELINRLKPANLNVFYDIEYMTWDELDARILTWDELDAKKINWDIFETGIW